MAQEDKTQDMGQGYEGKAIKVENRRKIVLT